MSIGLQHWLTQINRPRIYIFCHVWLVIWNNMLLSLLPGQWSTWSLEPTHDIAVWPQVNPVSRIMRSWSVVLLNIHIKIQIVLVRVHLFILHCAYFFRAFKLGHWTHVFILLIPKMLHLHLFVCLTCFCTQQISFHVVSNHVCLITPLFGFQLRQVSRLSFRL